MKALITLLVLFISLSSHATVVRYNLDQLLGETLYKSDDGEGANYLLLDIENSPIRVIQEARIVINFERVNLASMGRVVFRVFGEETASHAISADHQSLTMAYQGEFDPLVNVDPYLEVGFWEFQFTLDSYYLINATTFPPLEEYVIFGPNSYLEMSDTNGELFTSEVPEPLIASVVAITGFGLFRRRKVC
ncbi:hypothetical protein OPS25_09820 [Alteromonas ponticola]|uniref:PEP-CTERM sorting domain-containing protein n=1 Tax=Alteromonas aquimaris TaxID=2998417 RepID=A0ABT3P7N6_9ALTE|nr:hypothetical protein [Alteromonas aquimaris]MCW8108791.1 hypothetical protein [Alteromonas aquimaris]